VSVCDVEFNSQLVKTRPCHTLFDHVIDAEGDGA
jgi:hypothetical protein